MLCLSFQHKSYTYIYKGIYARPPPPMIHAWPVQKWSSDRLAQHFQGCRVQECCTVPKTWPGQTRNFETVQHFPGSTVQLCYCPNLFALEPKRKSAVLSQKTFKTNVSGTYRSQEPEGSWRIGFLRLFWDSTAFLGSAPKGLGQYGICKAPECKSSVLYNANLVDYLSFPDLLA